MPVTRPHGNTEHVNFTNILLRNLRKLFGIYHPFEKILKDLLPKNHEKSILLAIVGHFSGFSPNDICFSVQNDLSDLTLVLEIPRFLDFKS